MVELVHASKRFGDVVAVADLCLQVRAGEFLTLLGPSGCGKTTTLRLIAGFEQPSSGEIFIAGQRVNHLPPHRREVNTVFQSYALFPHLNVFENVAFGLRLRHVPDREVVKRVREALALVQLEGYEQRWPRQLSGGQQQRVALARALVLAPRVLLLDEPLGALDLKLRREMQLELKALQRRLGTTFVYVTHDQEEALTMSDRIAVMNGGTLEQLGEAHEVYEHPATRFVAEFLGEANLVPAKVLEVAERLVTAEVHGPQLPPTRLLVAREPTARLSPGDEVLLMVRPERLRLEPEGDEGTHALGGVSAGPASLPAGGPGAPWSSWREAGSPARAAERSVAVAQAGPPWPPGGRLAGTVVEGVFAGPVRRWVVELAPGLQWRVQSMASDELPASLTPGQRVWVSWSAGDARLLPR